jgi:hypothetical protein
MAGASNRQGTERRWRSSYVCRTRTSGNTIPTKQKFLLDHGVEKRQHYNDPEPAPGSVKERLTTVGVHKVGRIPDRRTGDFRQESPDNNARAMHPSGLTRSLSAGQTPHHVTATRGGD